MAKQHKTPPSIGDRWLWYLLVIGGVCVLISAIPAVPWRYSRTDTNVGNRFVMDRWYNLFGATNQFGKTVNWFTLEKKLQRKSQEFGKASPLTALVGTVGSGLGTGGAALGCATWQACKDHVNQRYLSYMTVARCGMACFAAILLGALCCVGTVLLMNWDQDNHKQKKKKKHHQDNPCELSPKAKTMTCCIFGFVLSFGGVFGFLFLLDSTLKGFKDTAYYPYASSHVAPYIGGLGCLLVFISMIMTINRVTPLFGNPDGDEQQQQQQQPMVPQYGAGSGAYGAYPPQGKGGYAGYQSWAPQQSPEW